MEAGSEDWLGQAECIQLINLNAFYLWRKWPRKNSPHHSIHQTNIDQTASNKTENSLFCTKKHMPMSMLNPFKKQKALGP